MSYYYYHSGKRFWSHHGLFSERAEAFQGAERTGITRQGGRNISLPQSTDKSSTYPPAKYFLIKPPYGYQMGWNSIGRNREKGPRAIQGVDHKK